MSKRKKILKEKKDDIEEIILKKWSENIKDLDLDEINELKKKIGKDKVISSAYNLIFTAKEKTAKAKIETNKRLSSKLWVANLVVASLAVFIFSVAITHFTPEKAKEIQSVFDKILLFPAKKIKDLGIKYNLINPVCKQEAERTPSKSDLINYIKNNQNKLQQNKDSKTASININQDDFGRVAGIEESVKEKETELLNRIKKNIKNAVFYISEEQKNISFALNNKLKAVIKNIKN